MQFERTLTEEEILTALQKGSDKAAAILKQRETNPGFVKSMYDRILEIVDRAEENFSLDGYRRKNHIYSKGKESLTEKNIRSLFLCAMESVQCLEEIEPVVKPQKTPLMDEGRGLDRHIKLVKAATVFRTDGMSDIPALDVERAIQCYRAQKLDAA